MKAKRKPMPRDWWKARPYFLPHGVAITAKHPHALRFCAPGCGSHCLMSDFKRAEVRGASLCRRLGKEWRTRVWENMGWFVEAVHSSGYLKVSGKARNYTCYFGAGHGGRWVGTGNTPKRALADAIDLARTELKGIQFLLDAAEAA